MNKGTELIARILKLASIAEQTNINKSSESWVAYFNEVSPANIRELIAALEQTRQESKVQLETIANVTELWNEQRQRIAELENDEVRQCLANAEHQLHMAELAKHNLKASRSAQFRKRLAAEKRIAELEAASVKPVKLPEGFIWSVVDNDDWLKKSDVIAAIQAAGGSVKGSD